MLGKCKMLQPKSDKYAFVGYPQVTIEYSSITLKTDTNVSIIFDAPCLFYTNCFMFYLHFMAFLCIFWN
jgi:hypothetical protein